MRQEMHDSRALAIMECAAKQMSVAATAEALGLNKATIYNYSRNYKINFDRNFPELLREQAKNGFTMDEAAKNVGLSYSRVSQIARAEKLTFTKSYTLSEKEQERIQSRANIMAALYKDGYTLQQIAEQYGISRERVRQVISKIHGLSATDGGQHVTAEKRAAKILAKKDARVFKRCGCTYSQWLHLVELGRIMQAEGHGGDKTPTRAWTRQRWNAVKRGISFELSLWQWWKIWEASGKWDERGRGQGYVMCRNNDEGPYAIGNVFIATAAQNSSEGTKKSDLPIGVRVNKGGQGFVATRQINGEKRRLGRFDTPEMAHAAYLMAGAA